MLNWLKENKKGITYGFVFGALVALPLAILIGSISSSLFGKYIPTVEPLVIGPVMSLNFLINSFYHPLPLGLHPPGSPLGFEIPYDLILKFGFNGICYALLGGFIQSMRRKHQ